ncbi:MAG: hypothetical protein ABSG00_06170 [Terracidiphilus sp.]|jgi:hypothetical protein
MHSWEKFRSLRKPGKILLAGALLAVAIVLVVAIVSRTLPQATASALPFDRPVHVTKLPLPRDPSNPQSKPMLSCYYFPHFMIKEIDSGGLGADQLSILSETKDHQEPACRKDNSADEKVIDWEGDFIGVKGGFVFFEGGDADTNGGMDFGVYSSGGTKLFEDIAGTNTTEGFRSIELLTPVAAKDHRITYNNGIELKYKRSYMAPCSLRADEANCWKSIKQATGLTNASPPDCSSSYEALEKTSQDKLGSDSDPTVIWYEIEVVLDDTTPVVRVSPASEVEACAAAV